MRGGRIETQPGLLAPPPGERGYYRTIYIDCPWPERGGGKIKRGADRHYPLMTLPQIFGLPVGLWAASDAHCYSWVTNNYLEAGLQALHAWGFRFVTTVTWVKDKAGLGQYYRGRTEHCLFAVRGRLPYRVRADGKRAQGQTVIYEPDWPVDELPAPADLPDAFEAPRQEHSAKPEEMRRYCEVVSPGPRLEMFARRPSEGWDVWGNEIA